MQRNNNPLHLGYTPIGPSWRAGPYALGADAQGRDVASRLLCGGRNSLMIASAAALLGLTLATFLSLWAGYAGGWVKRIVSWIMTMLWAVPIYLFASCLSMTMLRDGLRLGPMILTADNRLIPVCVIAAVYLPYAARLLNDARPAIGATRLRQNRRSFWCVTFHGGGAGNPTRATPVPYDVFSASDGALPAGGVRSFLSFTRGAGAGYVLGVNDTRRGGADLYPSRCCNPARHDDHADRSQPLYRFRRLHPRLASARHDMSFILRRFTHGIAVLAGISVVMFTVFFATPGTDPAARLAGKGASPALLAEVRHQYGFDRPLPQQYARMMYGIFIQRRLTSYVHHGQNVVTQVMAAAPVTFSLVGLAAVITALGCLSLGMGAALLGHRVGPG